MIVEFSQPWNRVSIVISVAGLAVPHCAAVADLNRHLVK